MSISETQRLRVQLQRRKWRRREQHSDFHVYFCHLRHSPEKFEEYLEMSLETFDALFHHFQDDLRDTRFRRSVCMEQRLVVTLRYLASGDDFYSLHDQYRLGVSTISRIVNETCKVLWEKLQPTFLPHPTRAQWSRIADKFFQKAKFPNCIGAVDGKRVAIQKPPGSRSNDTNSIIVMAIADAGYRFVAVDMVTDGRTNDYTVFKQSRIGKSLSKKSFGIPSPRPLPGTEGPPVPFVLVGDEAFQMSENLMTPYASSTLNTTEQIYNNRLSKARDYVECAFVLLTTKWKVLTTVIPLRPENVENLVKACVVLHNFVADHELLVVDPKDCDSELINIKDSAPSSTTAVMQIRDQFADYFVSPEGSVPGQENF